jgi:hypothetical protein
MATDQAESSRGDRPNAFTAVGSRATAALRRLADPVGVAVDAEIAVERRAADHVLDSTEPERVVMTGDQRWRVDITS